jgi:hypothetical protein
VFVAYVYIWRKGGLDWAETPPDLAVEPDGEDELEVATTEGDVVRAG